MRALAVLGDYFELVIAATSLAVVGVGVLLLLQA